MTPIAILAAAARAAPEPGFLSPAGVQSVAALISALIWPAVVLFVVITFRSQLAEIIAKIEEVELPGGIKAKIKRQLAEAGTAAEGRTGLSGPPTGAEVKRAEKVDELVGTGGLPFLKRQAEELAAEYERERAARGAGPERTGAMEKVMAKMRAIGRAAFPLRHELATSASPGQRLQAIAILQMEPDDDYLPWLVERVRQEKPFLGYHAAVALLAAANRPDAVRFLKPLQDAAAQTRTGFTLRHDTDREQTLEAFRRKVAELAPA